MCAAQLESCASANAPGGSSSTAGSSASASTHGTVSATPEAAPSDSDTDAALGCVAPLAGARAPEYVAGVLREGGGLEASMRAVAAAGPTHVAARLRDFVRSAGVLLTQ